MGKEVFDRERAFKAIMGIRAGDPEPGADAAREPEPAGRADGARGRRGRPKGTREAKKRYTITTYPSAYESLQRIAYVERKSASGIITELIEEYVRENGEKEGEYGRIKNAGGGGA